MSCNTLFWSSQGVCPDYLKPVVLQHLPWEAV
jgi:hypothetical protein